MVSARRSHLVPETFDRCPGQSFLVTHRRIPRQHAVFASRCNPQVSKFGSIGAICGAATSGTRAFGGKSKPVRYSSQLFRQTPKQGARVTSGWSGSWQIIARISSREAPRLFCRSAWTILRIGKQLSLSHSQPYNGPVCHPARRPIYLSRESSVYCLESRTPRIHPVRGPRQAFLNPEGLCPKIADDLTA
jgi:hypothetical protein